MISEFKSPLSVLRRQLIEIENYIELVNKEKYVISEINSSDLFLSFANIQNFKENLISTINTAMAYNAIIISLYGCFEKYIDSLLTTYLEKITKVNEQYLNLPNDLKESHIKLTAEFLQNPHRYKDMGLQEKEVINNLSACISNQLGYKLNIKILLKHQGNLTIDSLNDLCHQIGILNFATEIKTTYSFVRYYQTLHEIPNWDSSLHSINSIKDNNLLFEPLIELVRRRNEVSHGWSDDNRLSAFEIKDEFISFIRCLTESIFFVVLKNYFLALYKNGQMEEFMNTFSVNDHRILCTNSQNSKLNIGDFILVLKSNKKYDLIEITSLQIDNVAFESIEQDYINIGIGIYGRISKSDRFFYMKPT
jgi:hypothetical protein